MSKILPKKYEIKKRELKNTEKSSGNLKKICDKHLMLYKVIHIFINESHIFILAIHKKCRQRAKKLFTFSIYKAIVY